MDEEAIRADEREKWRAYCNRRSATCLEAAKRFHREGFLNAHQSMVGRSVALKIMEAALMTNTREDDDG